jgi:hypothetical protein
MSGSLVALAGGLNQGLELHEYEVGQAQHVRRGFVFLLVQPGHKPLEVPLARRHLNLLPDSRSFDFDQADQSLRDWISAQWRL